MPLLPGKPAPWFIAATPSNPQFAFDTAAGRYVLLLFEPAEPAARGGALKALAAHQGLFDDVRACAFVVLRDPASAQGLKDLRGLRWVSDRSGQITAGYGGQPHWLLLDPTMRVLASEPVEAAEAMLTILPLPRSSMPGSQARIVRNIDRTLMSKARSQSASVQSRTVPPWT